MKTFIYLLVLALSGLNTHAQRISGADNTGNGQASCTVEVAGPVTYANLMGSVELKFFVQPVLSAGGPNNYVYEWIFTYSDYAVSSSNEREPLIPVACSNPVKRVYVKVSAAPGCFKEFSYTYPDAGICGTEGQLKIAPFPVAPDTAVAPAPDSVKCTSKTKILKLKG